MTSRRVAWEYLPGDDLNELEELLAGGESFVCSTSFPLSQSEVDKVANVEGVEFAYYNSRYRFSMTVGRLFNSSDVRLAVQNALKVTPHDLSHIPQEFRGEVSKVVNDLSLNRYWVLKLKDSGEPQEQFSSNHLAEVSITLERMKKDKGAGEKVLTNIR